MKQKLQPKWIPLIALWGGVVGFLLQLWLLATGFDSRGLLREDHPAIALSFILTALVLGAMYLCLRPLEGLPAYNRLFPRCVPAAVGSVIGAAGILIAQLQTISFTDPTTLPGVVIACGAAAGLVLAGIARFQGKRPAFWTHGLVTVYLIVHLVTQYRAWNSEPQVPIFCFRLLASVFLMLCAYYHTVLDAGKGSRRWYVFTNYGALFFCCTAAAQADRLFYLSMAIWTGTSACSLRPVCTPQTMYLPENVLYCIKRLKDAGFQAFAVGGCVRDSLLGRMPKDYDLCTDATPEQIVDVFYDHKQVTFGEKHGTVSVVADNELIEITTFRTEGDYTDSRHPGWVSFVKDVKEDLARRDFTVNAMAFSPDEGYIDPFGGQQDLENKVLRAVGEPEVRFQEDALRILRGVRFAARYDLQPEEKTLQAMFALAPSMENLARERIFSELCGLLPYITADQLITYAPILTQVMPELAPCVDFDQHSVHHAYDVYTHTAKVVEAVPNEEALRWAALLHDIGKPTTFTQDEEGNGHFHGHAKVSAEMAASILLRLKAPNALRQQVVFLIEHHMSPMEPDKKLLRRRLAKYGDEGVRQLLTLQEADCAATGVVHENDPDFAKIRAMLEELCQDGTCRSVKDLAINGSDLLELGVAPGKQIGACMAFLLELVHDELIPNTKEALLRAAKDYFANNEEESL